MSDTRPLSPQSNRRSAVKVLSAAGLVVVLGATLTARLMAQSGPSRSRAAAVPDGAPVAPEATVPAPKPIVLADLPVPYCWSCPSPEPEPLLPHIDLDLLAPLGDGAANAGIWLRDFAKADGSRRDDDWYSRRVEMTFADKARKVLPGDDPLLLEAEPWVDQATVRFYPDFWTIDGPDTTIPNLLLPLTLSRGWWARGTATWSAPGAGDAEYERARDDFRRAMRLGRLLLQDESVLIQKLVAIACLRAGADGLYRLSRATGDAPTMVAAGILLNDLNGMRLKIAERLTSAMLHDRVHDGVLHITADEVDKLAAMSAGDPEPPLRAEAVFALYTVMHTAADEPLRERARDAIAKAESDRFHAVAAIARWAQSAPYDEAFVEQMGN